MSEIDHSAAKRLMDAYFAGEPLAGELEQMRAHLSTCDGCREIYDRHCAAESTVLGQREASFLADDRLLGAVLADPKVQSKTNTERRWWPVFVLAPAAALAVALVFTVTVAPSQSGGGLAARGVGDSTNAIGVGIGVAGIIPKTGQVYDARQPEGVQLDHRLRFTYSNTGTARYLFIFSVDDALQPFWYYPLPEEGQSISIEGGPGVSQQVLPFETELKRRHKPGRLRVLGLFSEQPITLNKVAKALEQARANRTPLDEVSWPGQPQVHSLELSIVESAGQ